MKRTHILAAAYPALWIIGAICQIGKKIPPQVETHYTGGILLSALIVLIPTAVIAYLCGKNRKEIDAD